MAAPSVDLRVEFHLPTMLSEWTLASGVRVTVTMNNFIPVVIKVHQVPMPAAVPNWRKRSVDGKFTASISRHNLRKSKQDDEELGQVGIRSADASADAASVDLIARIRAGLVAGKAPEPIEDGEGGTYKLFGADGNVLAIFKPTDEEPHSDANPKKHDSSPKRDGIAPGECARREVAAYKLDRGFAGVPCTAMVQLRHPRWGTALKTGSVQLWKNDAESGADVGSSEFSVNDVQRIGALDVRMLNTDRHEGNLLVTRDDNGRATLTPIDHGFALPSSLGEAYFAWQHWSQAKKPFAPDVLAAIAAIDSAADAEVMRELGFSDLEVRNMRVSTLFLQRAAAAGWTLHEIANFVARPALDKVSRLELLVADAKVHATSAGNFWEHYARLVDETVSRRVAAPSA